MDWKGLNIQNSLTNSSMKIAKIMEFSFLILFSISIFVFFLLTNITMNNLITKKYKEMPNLELVWTFFPSIILIFIAYPSILNLYLIESKKNQNLNIKITGHQWYWNYDYFNKFNFDSYLESKDWTNYRLLETDNHLVLPMSNNFLIVTSEDVLHSWSVPSMMIKMDANPGRLNSILLKNNMTGIFYGQCSEICGSNHTFMPITLESVNFFLFKEWFLIKNLKN